MSDGKAVTDPSLEAKLEAIREKYRQERDKRLRQDAEDQYIKTQGEFARYSEEDPFVENRIERAPLTDEVEVAIIGGGFSGLMAAAHLQENGVEDLRIIEAAGDFGGAWYWNRYPGAQCDIEGYIYLPLLEETGYVPKEKYSFAGEIFEHCRRIGKHYDLYGRACFQTRVKEIVWDEAIKRWLIRTDRQDEIKAKYVVTAGGSGPRPKLPGIPGIETFKGASFHTSRWDYGFTGGDPNAQRWDFQVEGGGESGKLDKLGDKNVALIGTGATALQCLPYLARDAKHVYLFQRTPSMVGARGGNPVTDPEWVKTLKPGWQHERRVNFEAVMAGRPTEVDLVQDCWTKMFRNMRAAITPDMTPQEAALKAEVYDLQMMERVRDEIAATVKDPELAEALKPWYRPSCKRPGYNDEYLEAFNRSNVTLVDVAAAKGVERITEDGIVANGVEYKVDCIVFATGFELTITDFTKGVGFEIIGRGGESLRDHWSKGLRTLHGYSTAGFPNWFYVGISQNALGFNQGYMLEEQTRHIAHIISQAKERGAKVVEVDPKAESAWVDKIHEMARVNREFLESCTPGFYNNEGKLRGGLTAEIYSPGIQAFNDLLAEWRAKGDLEGFRLES